MTDENIQLSIVVPCRQEATAIRPFLESILENDYPQDQLEVLIVDGMSDDGTREVVEAFARQHPRIRLLDNPEQITPCALNIGIRQAKGQIIMRMDAHYEYPPDYISTLVDWLGRSGVDNVGGMVVMHPANDGPLARAIAAAVAHPFGIGNAYYRIGASQPRRVDTVPFGCYRREVFDRVGLFDEELVRNQDIELNLRLIREGGSILLVPGVVIAGQARQSFSKLVRTYFQYAYFNALVVRKLGRMMSLRHGIPGLFAAFLLLGGALAPLCRWHAGPCGGRGRLRTLRPGVFPRCGAPAWDRLWAGHHGRVSRDSRQLRIGHAQRRARFPGAPPASRPETRRVDCPDKINTAKDWNRTPRPAASMDTTSTTMTASKRIFDLVLATLGILLIWPVLLLVALAIKCNDGGSVFFRQERVGEGGKRFRIWKFRTMRSAPQGNGNPLTVGQDPRVTAVGSWLRRSKLDELPQLFNVIRGEMSFVGPRPELPYFVDQYTAEQRRVLQFRPGVTSLASIKFLDEDDLLGRVEDPERFFMEKIVPERARTDLEYAARATVLSDLMVMAKTVLRLGRRSAPPQDDAACCRQSTAPEEMT